STPSGAPLVVRWQIATTVHRRRSSGCSRPRSSPPAAYYEEVACLGSLLHRCAPFGDHLVDQRRDLRDTVAPRERRLELAGRAQITAVVEHIADRGAHCTRCRRASA